MPKFNATQVILVAFCTSLAWVLGETPKAAVTGFATGLGILLGATALWHFARKQ